MKRIAIITASLGNGHNAAALALAETISSEDPASTVKIFDLTNNICSLTKLLFFSWYTTVFGYFPLLWKFLYQSTNTKYGTIISTKIFKIIADRSSRRFSTILEKFSPDKIIATHFFAPYFLNTTQLKKIPLSMVVTDYGWHPLWYHPSNTNYFVASSDIKEWLTNHYPILPEKIILSPIPVSPRLYEKTDMAATKIKYGLPVEHPLILILNSCSGTMNSINFIPHLWKIPNLSIVVITGKDDSLQKKINALPWPPQNNHAILGWTNDMPNFLQAATVVVTKPGGLITSECLAIGKPMILVSPIPGQEEANLDYLLKIKAAESADSPQELIKKITDYLK
ncbi:MAG: hypothetical protein A2821_04110 [Candidatus Magasanikbacteria bacterium RIFCSPHIGHO2_01_FULL_41_23]|uniref:Diacylglycerol glucosyltransferase N-terminal domain-containing protein n=1 Tax=Candidatus Magasanikbacteria bacterium RIFCSPLOWO2_01_FULL_40_15 TaxID=1798686 RepID=A0A1F6N3U8_9BACT|nr:MAG: hypothetical protein A2821_04110 [Candidatus Magasanikbacteria bacterium RIFCSPHIGHO2_01_FULL_41_23]OGH76351.1 MAG: hypothetical protein A3F22_04445 [Candidatus Magasanikbacteria bacterium RIFCSPHIGHO2_12_FULL_41_16]OGH78343.1 MAG: hypothetical protein A2983_01110 [Candidatus Magasanikbacteria bacterium RIFCSPLOWO2_01_FULL_40_15]